MEYLLSLANVYRPHSVCHCYIVCVRAFVCAGTIRAKSWAVLWGMITIWFIVLYISIRSAVILRLCNDSYCRDSNRSVTLSC